MEIRCHGTQSKHLTALLITEPAAQHVNDYNAEIHRGRDIEDTSGKGRHIQ